MTDLQEKYAEKIAKLLAKAESTTQEEAEALIAKAQELMMQYSIEQAMIDEARGVEREAIIQTKIYFTGNYREDLAGMAWSIIRVNNCQGVQWSTMHDDGGRKAVKHFPGTKRTVVTSEKKARVLEVTGFTSDIERVLMLEASLRLQAVSAQTTWWNSVKAEHDWRTYAEKVRIRREFVQHFASAVANKLRIAAQTGQDAAIKTETARTGEDASDSVALVLRSRKDQVQDWYDNHYGSTLRSGRASYRARTNTGAGAAGYEAGTRADVGQTGLRGRKGLNK